MFYSEAKSELGEIDENIKNNLEYYYHANLILNVFAIGAFIFYIFTGTSRGVFLLLDIFLIYKALKGFFRVNKLKKGLIGTGEHLNLIKGVIIFNIFLLMESITRHFLEMNIDIIEYLWIMALVYCSTMIIYRGMRIYNKKRIYKAISMNNYNSIISLKKTKEKIFTVLSLFLILALVIVKLTEIFKGGEFVALMTFIYVCILLLNLDIASEVSIEYALIVKGKLRNIEITHVKNEDFEEESSFNDGDTLSGFEAITDEQIENYNTEKNELYSNNNRQNNKEDLDETATMSFIEDEPVIKSRTERRREAKKKKFRFFKEINVEAQLNKVKEKIQRKK